MVVIVVVMVTVMVPQWSPEVEDSSMRRKELLRVAPLLVSHVATQPLFVTGLVQSDGAPLDVYRLFLALLLQVFQIFS